MKRKRKKNVKKHDTHACTLHVIAAQKIYFYFLRSSEKNADMKMDQVIKKSVIICFFPTEILEEF